MTALVKGTNSQSWTITNQRGRRFVLRCALGNDGHEGLEAMAAAAIAVAAAGVETKTPVRARDGSYTACDDQNRPWQCWTWLGGHQPVGADGEAAVLGAELRRFHDALSDWLKVGLPAHDPYWPLRFDMSDVIGAIGRLQLPAIDSRQACEIARSAHDLLGEINRLKPTAGHGDCHTDNWLIMIGGKRAAIIDLELIGTRPGAQLTDLGVLMHRMARLAANFGSGAARPPTEAARGSALAIAKSYGADVNTAKVALDCAIHESLAKIIGCAWLGPPGLDRAARCTIAANHCLYLAELTSIRSALDSYLA